MSTIFGWLILYQSCDLSYTCNVWLFHMLSILIQYDMLISSQHGAYCKYLLCLQCARNQQCFSGLAYSNFLQLHLPFIYFATETVVLAVSGSHVFYSFRFLQFLNLPTRRGQYLLMSGFGILYSLCIMFTFTCISSFKSSILWIESFWNISISFVKSYVLDRKK